MQSLLVLCPSMNSNREFDFLMLTLHAADYRCLLVRYNNRLAIVDPGTDKRPAQLMQLAGFDAVDGSSTGTRVPWMQALLMRPLFEGARLCKRSRLSALISRSQSFKFMASMQTAM